MTTFLTVTVYVQKFSICGKGHSIEKWRMVLCEVLSRKPAEDHFKMIFNWYQMEATRWLFNFDEWGRCVQSVIR